LPESTDLQSFVSRSTKLPSAHLNLILCSRDGGLRVQESNPLLVSSPSRSSLDAPFITAFRLHPDRKGFQSLWPPA